MPSPFPGMDPYLEAPHLWPGVHHSLIVCFLEDLQPKLPPEYVAVIERRMVVEPTGQRLVPDVSIMADDVLTPWLLREGVAVREGPPTRTEGRPPRPLESFYWIESDDLEVPQGYLEIRTVGEGEVVTVVEVLSPSNKTRGQARDAYLDKQEALRQTSVNLVEIDLLRAGLHTVAAPARLLDPTDYRVCIRLGHRSHGFALTDFSVRQPLRPLPIPLRPDTPTVPLDLPGALRRCYDTGGFAKQIDYGLPPEPPLADDEARWAEALLREKGIRPEAPGAQSG